MSSRTPPTHTSPSADWLGSHLPKGTRFASESLDATLGCIQFSKNSLRATPGSRRETTSVSFNSIHTLLKSSMLFVKIIFAVFSDG
jgi:hypothetical protein